VLISLNGPTMICESMSRQGGRFIVISGTRLVDLMTDTHDIHFHAPNHALIRLICRSYTYGFRSPAALSMITHCFGAPPPPLFLLKTTRSIELVVQDVVLECSSRLSSLETTLVGGKKKLLAVFSPIRNSELRHPRIDKSD